MFEKILTNNFQYKHHNPYHEKLKEFSDFVLRDHEGENLKGRWAVDEFHHNTDIVLEIGTGYGHFMKKYCLKMPETNFIGLDYKFKRSFRLVKNLNKIRSITNFRYLRARAERLLWLFSPNELKKIFIFFPDPWPKRKHHKKRLLQLEFLQILHTVLRNDGCIYIKTDHVPLSKWMIEQVERSHLFHVEFFTKDLYGEDPHHFLTEYQTYFEKIFLSQNKKIISLQLTPL